MSGKGGGGGGGDKGGGGGGGKGGGGSGKGGSKGGDGGGKGGGGSTKSGGGGSGESGRGLGSMKASGGDSRKYYRYIGSLTTLSYTENVAWTIVNKVRTVSRAQLYEIHDVVHNEAKANARPVHALNNRWLKLQRPDDQQNN